MDGEERAPLEIRPERTCDLDVVVLAANHAGGTRGATELDHGVEAPARANASAFFERPSEREERDRLGEERIAGEERSPFVEGAVQRRLPTAGLIVVDRGKI